MKNRDHRKATPSAVGRDPQANQSFGPRRVRNWRPWAISMLALLLLAFAAGAQSLADGGVASWATSTGDDAGTAVAGSARAAALARADAGGADAGLDGGVHHKRARGDRGSAEAEGDELSDEELERALPETDDEMAEASDAGPAEAPAVVSEVPAAAANAVAQMQPVPGLSLLRKAKLEAGEGGEALFAQTAEGKSARLSIQPRLQQQMEKLFALYKPMSGALVAIEPKTGRVLALVEYSADGHSEGAATHPLYPAASVFKIITGAALLEKGISPDAETCYHGGMHAIVGKLLQDKPRLDRNCISLSMALAKSANVVFAKMAERHLDSAALRGEAEKFLFNRSVWSDPSVTASTAVIPERGLEFAKSAAGFGDVKLSPLHAALIAAAVGNGGDMRDPTLIDSLDGVPAPAQGERRILRAETASTLKEMMKLTVSEGTAARSFRARQGKVLGDIEVAGKTGSLSNHEKPFKDYSWFVGFAPADDPKIAVAAVVVNGLKWSIHAPYVAREALRAYLVGGSLGTPPPSVSHHSHRRVAKKHK